MKFHPTLSSQECWCFLYSVTFPAGAFHRVLSSFLYFRNVQRCTVKEVLWLCATTTTKSFPGSLEYTWNVGQTTPYRKQMNHPHLQTKKKTTKASVKQRMEIPPSSLLPLSALNWAHGQFTKIRLCHSMGNQKIFNNLQHKDREKTSDRSHTC